MELGASVLTTDDVLPGVAQLVGTLQVEGYFEDGQKLVTIHDPIAPGAELVEGVVPGEVVTAEGEIELSAGRETTQVTVTNGGDRPIQVGSHYHFFEVNPALLFDREAAFGMHLDIPAGTAVRFEPGEEQAGRPGGASGVTGRSTASTASRSGRPARRLARRPSRRAGERGFLRTEEG